MDKFEYKTLGHDAFHPSLKTYRQTYLILTKAFWNGKQLNAELSFVRISSTFNLWVANGRDGSWIAKTFTTISPSVELARATLKNLVLPRL